jgi:hypothetical protein
MGVLLFTPCGADSIMPMAWHLVSPQEPYGITPQAEAGARWPVIAIAWDDAIDDDSNDQFRYLVYTEAGLRPSWVHGDEVAAFFKL